MIIKYTNFSDGIHQISFQEQAEKLGFSDHFLGLVNVDCTMDKSLHQIVLSCNISIDSRMNCDRCNSEYIFNITTNFRMTYIFSKEHNLSDELNFRFLSAEDDKIDITNDVFEYIQLAIPMKKLCKEDCKGLCSKCGINLNEKKCKCKTELTNDVWEPLKKLKFNN